MALFLCPFSWSWQSHTFQQLIALKGSQPCVAALLQLVPCLFRGAALCNGAGRKQKHSAKIRHGSASYGTSYCSEESSGGA